MILPSVAWLIVVPLLAIRLLLASAGQFLIRSHTSREASSRAPSNELSGRSIPWRLCGAAHPASDAENVSSANRALWFSRVSIDRHCPYSAILLYRGQAGWEERSSREITHLGTCACGRALPVSASHGESF